MKSFYFLLLLLVFVINAVVCDNDDGSSQSPEDREKLKMGEKRIGNQIRLILKHYQQKNPVGLPGDFVPDPKDVPDVKQNIMMNDMHFTKIKVYGLSNFRIVEINVELAKMQAGVKVFMPKVFVRGLYEESCLWCFSSQKNNFTIEMTDITIAGMAQLIVGLDGKLFADDVDMDLNVVRIEKNFENLGGLSSMVDTIMDGTFIFNLMKPMILTEVNTNIRGQVNKKLVKLPNQFPNSVSPFDMAIFEARREVRKAGIDPLIINNQVKDIGIFTTTLKNTSVVGLSHIYRVGNVTIGMQNDTAFADITVSTGQIEAKAELELSLMGGMFSKTGYALFTVEYFRANVRLTQPLDIREKLSLERVDLELGNIQMRVNNIAGTLDYVIEGAVNIAPNLLRYQIMDAVEEPLKRRLQAELDKINVEEFIEKNIPKIEEQMKEFESLLADDEEQS